MSHSYPNSDIKIDKRFTLDTQLASLECLEVESDLTDAGTDGCDGVAVGGGGHGGPGVAGAPDV